MGALLIHRKRYFNILKHCYSPSLAATCMDFSPKMEQFIISFKSYLVLYVFCIVCIGVLYMCVCSGKEDGYC